MGSQPELTTLAEQFDRSRGHLRAVAFRMLGSADEADDAVQEAWLRASRADFGAVANLPGWLTTIVSRVCLDLLRARRRHPEAPVDLAELDLAPAGADGAGPEDEAVSADSVGLALLVVLDRLGPAERVAFVLHDLFAVPFDEIAEVVDRSPAAAKKLASRARARVRGAAAVPAADLAVQRRVVEAFLAASRAGDLAGLLAVLAPDVVRRMDRAVPPAAAPAGRPTRAPAEAAAEAAVEGPAEVRGARAVAEETLANSGRARFARAALVNGAVGIVVAPRGRLALVLETTVDGGRITELNVIADPARLRSLDLAVLDVTGP